MHVQFSSKFMFKIVTKEKSYIAWFSLTRRYKRHLYVSWLEQSALQSDYDTMQDQKDKPTHSESKINFRLEVM